MVLAAAGLGGLGSRDAPSTYARLDKPGWAPPASGFGPIWTALYASLALIAALDAAVSEPGEGAP